MRKWIYEDTLTSIKNSIINYIASNPNILSYTIDTDYKYYIIETSLHNKYVIPVEKLKVSGSTDYKKLRYYGDGSIINGEIYDTYGKHVGRAYYGVPTNHNHVDYDPVVFEYGKYPAPNSPGMDIHTFMQQVNNGLI